MKFFTLTFADNIACIQAAARVINPKKASKMDSIPKPMVYTWAALSALLNICSLASVVDGLVIWADFFTSIIDVYRITIRAPLVAVLGYAGLPVPPPWLVDILVIWTTSFVLARTFIAFEFKDPIYPVSDDKLWVMIILFLVAPIWPIAMIFIVSHNYKSYARTIAYKQCNRPTVVYVFKASEVARRAAIYVLALLGTILLLLLINYQLLKLQ